MGFNSFTANIIGLKLTFVLETEFICLSLTALFVVSKVHKLQG